MLKVALSDKDTIVVFWQTVCWLWIFWVNDNPLTKGNLPSNFQLNPFRTVIHNMTDVILLLNKFFHLKS